MNVYLWNKSILSSPKLKCLRQNFMVFCSFYSISYLANYSRSFRYFYSFFFFRFICGRSSITILQKIYIYHWLLYPFYTVHRYQSPLETHLPAYLWVFTISLSVLCPYVLLSAYVSIIIYLIKLQLWHSRGRLHLSLSANNHL